MSKSPLPNDCSLQDVLSALMKSDPAKYHELRFVAHTIIGFFKRPAHEISIAAIKDRVRFFPLYLSFERLPSNLAEVLVRDADRIIATAGKVQRKKSTTSQQITTQSLRLRVCGEVSADERTQ